MQQIAEEQGPLQEQVCKPSPCRFIHILSRSALDNGPVQEVTQPCNYRKLASSNTSPLEAHAGFFRLLMKRDFWVLMYCDLTKS